MAMLRLISAVAVLSLALSQVSCKSILWTGIASNGQWATKQNWFPAQVPGPLDDVTIKSGSVTITSPVTVASIGMGDSFNHAANLTVDSSLAATSLKVEGNGNLILASGASAVTGTVSIEGSLTFTSGTISGTWTMSSKATTMLGGASGKTLSGCGFTAKGPVSISGLLVLNQSSVFTGQGTTTAQGNFNIQAQDTTAVMFDTSAGTLTYNGGGTFRVQAPMKIGTFNFNGGNLSLYESITFANSFNLKAGSVIHTVGLSQVSIPAGVTGMGEIRAQGYSLTLGNTNFSGTVVAMSGNLIAAKSTVGTLTVQGGSVWMSGAFNVANLQLESGSVNGASVLSAASTTILTSGFTINASVMFTKSVTCTGSTLSYTKLGTLTVASGATFTTVGAVVFQGTPGSGGFVNNGVFSVGGAASFQNIDVSGSGSITVTDMVKVSTMSFSQSMVALSGNGIFKGVDCLITKLGKVTGSPSVVGTIGSYGFSCPKECDSITTVGTPTTPFQFAVGTSKH